MAVDGALGASDEGQGGWFVHTSVGVGAAAKALFDRVAWYSEGNGPYVIEHYFLMKSDLYEQSWRDRLCLLKCPLPWDIVAWQLNPPREF